MVATSGMSGQRVSPVTARQRIVPALMWGAAGGIEPELNCAVRSEEHTSELQSLRHLVCRLLLEKKKKHPHQPASLPTQRPPIQPSTQDKHATGPTPIRHARRYRPNQQSDGPRSRTLLSTTRYP